MEKNEFIQMLSQHPELQKDLFIRGFLITDRQIDDLSAFPFYGNWRVQKHGKYFFMAHRLTGMHIYTDAAGNSFFIMGHAYNPFTMEHDETAILKHIADAYGTADYMERVNDLTGVFVYGAMDNEKISFLVDPSGMQSACYGIVGGNFYLSSHPQLIGDLCDLQMDAFVQELITYKWYGRVMGPYLPGDLTPFQELKRIVPNIAYQYTDEISHKRFWPLQEGKIVQNDEEYHKVITAAADILKNNMVLIPKKWNAPWISLTGGIDSNTTFAAANGSYDQYETFSYISAEKEVPDAEAAQKIADRFGLRHHVFHIPDTSAELKNFEEIRELLRHNNGYVAELYDNEARKRVYLRQYAQCDAEVKSWVSETIRGYWYKHFGRKSMPAGSGKLYRNLYKIFLTNRSLAHKVDRIFEDYIREFEYERIPGSYPPADMHFNEVTWGSWGGLNISEMKYCFDIVVPYSNRRLLELLFRIPLDKRIADQHHLDMKKYLNQEHYDMNIRVVNMHETAFRAFCLNIIFTINQFLPF